MKKLLSNWVQEAEENDTLCYTPVKNSETRSPWTPWRALDRWSPVPTAVTDSTCPLVGSAPPAAVFRVGKPYLSLCSPGDPKVR